MGGIWLLAAGLVLVFSQQAMEAAQTAATVFAANVMPSLFPMLVLGGLAQGARTEGRGRGLFLVLYGFGAGSPAAARQAAWLHQCSPFYPGELRVLLCMSGVMSPLFFLGPLGGYTGQRVGWCMLLAHWAGALATGGICRALQCRHAGSRPRQQPGSAPAKNPAQPRQGLLQALPAAVAQSTSALLSVLGAMMTFAVAAALLQALLTQLFPLWAARNQPLLHLLWALMEIGGGGLTLAAGGASPWLLCALCSFGGLSLWLQNLLFLGNMLRPTELLLWRMLHGALAGPICFCLLRLCP